MIEIYLLLIVFALCGVILYLLILKPNCDECKECDECEECEECNDSVFPHSLYIGYKLHSGNVLLSPNKKYKAELQSDGNLVVSTVSNNQVKWHINKMPGASSLVMQLDGNLVAYKNDGGAAYWASGTSGTGSKFLTLDNDGILSVGTSETIHWKSQ